MPHEKEKRDAILAALRAVVDAGGPQTPVVSTPRVTGSLTRPSSRDTSNPIETPMGKLLGLFSGLADPGNIGVGDARVVASGTATLVLTGQTAGEAFTVQNSGTGTYTSITTGTPPAPL